MKEENERLKKMLENGEESSVGRGGISESERKEMRSNVRASMREIDREIRKNLKSFAINTD